MGTENGGGAPFCGGMGISDSNSGFSSSDENKLSFNGGPGKDGNSEEKVELFKEGGGNGTSSPKLGISAFSFFLPKNFKKPNQSTLF